jgi:chemotaxis protein MotB
MKKWLLVVALLAFVGMGCVSQSSYNQLRDEYDKLSLAYKNVVTEHERLNSDLQGKNNELTALLSSARSDAEKWQAKCEAVDADWKMRWKALEAESTTGITRIPGGFALEENAFFDPGQAVLKDKGKTALKLVVEKVLKPTDYLQIEGNTDSDPIEKSKAQWKSGLNVELGAYRALAVIKFLKEECGVDANRMHLVSWGEYNPRPGVDGTSAQGKLKNRRVEIYVLPDNPARERQTATPPKDNKPPDEK